MTFLKQPLLRLPGPRGIPVHLMPGLPLAYACCAALLAFAGVAAETVLSLLGIILVSVVVHEWGHARAALRRGVRPTHLTLTAFGGLCHLPQRTLEGEIWIAVSGVLFNLGLATLCFCAALGVMTAVILTGGVPELLLDNTIFVGFLIAVLINLGMVVLNLLPFQPSDGGHILHLLLLKLLSPPVAQRVAGGVGFFGGLAWIATMVWLFLGHGWLVPVWPRPLLHWRMMLGQDGLKTVLQLQPDAGAVPA